MGNAVCCNKRKNKDEINQREVESLIKKKIKTKSKTDLVLKINEIKLERRGDIIFCILMGSSAIITIIVIAHGGTEPNVAASVLVSGGASLYYFSQILEKNKLIDLYQKELKERENK